MKFTTAFKTLLVFLLLAVMASGGALAARTQKEEKAPPMFPDATRAEPKIKPVAGLAKQMQTLQELSQEDKSDEVLVEADKLLANPVIESYRIEIAS